MRTAEFLDSNVLLYLGSTEVEKAQRVEDLLKRGCIVSIQVLDEFASVSSRKFRRTMAEIRRALTDIRSFCNVVVADIETHELGLDIAERYKFSVYDSMLIAAALQSECVTFYTEDLQHGQRIDGLTVRNPFTA